MLEIFKEKDCQQSVLYLTKLSFKKEGQSKIFPNKQKLKGLMSRKRVLPEILQGILFRLK